MANMNNLAHPYANAIFEYAKAHNSIDEWLNNLNILSEIAESKEFGNLITNPKINKIEVIKILMGFLQKPSESIEKLLVVLQENDRLQILSDINILFEKLVDEERNTAKAIIYTAFSMSEAQCNEFQDLLSKKLKKSISATVEVKPELIGGIKILINDLVIDASVRGSLDKMAAKII